MGWRMNCMRAVKLINGNAACNVEPAAGRRQDFTIVVC